MGIIRIEPPRGCSVMSRDKLANSILGFILSLELHLKRCEHKGAHLLLSDNFMVQPLDYRVPGYNPVASYTVEDIPWVEKKHNLENTEENRLRIGIIETDIRISRRIIHKVFAEIVSFLRENGIRLDNILFEISRVRALSYNITDALTHHLLKVQMIDLLDRITEYQYELSNTYLGYTLSGDKHSRANPIMESIRINIEIADRIKEETRLRASSVLRINFGKIPHSGRPKTTGEEAVLKDYDRFVSGAPEGCFGRIIKMFRAKQRESVVEMSPLERLKWAYRDFHAPMPPLGIVTVVDSPGDFVMQDAGIAGYISRIIGGEEISQDILDCHLRSSAMDVELELRAMGNTFKAYHLRDYLDRYDNLMHCAYAFRGFAIPECLLSEDDGETEIHKKAVRRIFVEVIRQTFKWADSFPEHYDFFEPSIVMENKVPDFYAIFIHQKEEGEFLQAWLLLQQYAEYFNDAIDDTEKDISEGNVSARTELEKFLELFNEEE